MRKHCRAVNNSHAGAYDAGLKQYAGDIKIQMGESSYEQQVNEIYVMLNHRCNMYEMAKEWEKMEVVERILQETKDIMNK